MDKWPKLKNPPVILAIIELRYNLGKDFLVSSFKKHDRNLLKSYPVRKDKLNSNINLPQPAPGISTAQISSTHSGFVYATDDKSKKLTVTKENLAFVLEGKYPGWDNFKKEALNCIENFENILSQGSINRVSIRFINKLSLSIEHAPEEYLNTLISAREGTIENEIDQYLIRYSMRLPNSRIKTNVIQSLEEKTDTEYKFIFDIDVLSHENMNYELSHISDELEKIRKVKNDIFFKNLTDQTLNQL